MSPEERRENEEFRRMLAERIRKNEAWLAARREEEERRRRRLQRLSFGLLGRG